MALTQVMRKPISQRARQHQVALHGLLPHKVKAFDPN